MSYNKFKRKYSREDIIQMYKSCKNKTEFLNKGVKKSIKFYNLKDEIDEYFDRIKENEYNIFKQTKTKEIVEQMKEYKSLSQFRHNRPDLYYYWNLWKISSPYIRQKFSTQEEILAQIVEFVFDKKCIRNYRKILNGKELDIYIPELKLAFEYNGWFWHKDLSIKDDNKLVLCEKKGIKLITIKETYNNLYSDLDLFLTDIKQKLYKNLQLGSSEINRLNKYEINHSELWKSCFGEEHINNLIASCNRYSEVKTKHNKIWQYLLRHNLLHLLQPIKDRDYIYMSKEKFIEYVIHTFPNYSQFVKHKIYKLARKRGYIKYIKQFYQSISP